MNRRVTDELGMALASAIVALVVVGALVAAMLFGGMQEQRLGENQRRVVQSFGVAEAALFEESHPAIWNAVLHNSMGIYPLDTAKLAWPTWKAAPGNTGLYRGYVVKLNENLYFMEMTGSDRASDAAGMIAHGGARQRLGMLLRVRLVGFPMQASLTALGGVALRGQAEVDGTDRNPSGWAHCGPPDTNKAGIRTSTNAAVVNSELAGIHGAPPVVEDSTVGDSTFTRFGDVLWRDLVAAATVRLGPGRYTTHPSSIGGGTACNTADVLNWGDGKNKTAPCGDYFPIIHLAGSATLNGGQGQGILLVDGDLTIEGSYHFYGVAIVQGDFRTSAEGDIDARFWGMTMARTVNLSTQTVADVAELNYSKCVIVNALQRTASVAQTRSRGWLQLYR
jgi:hypothetical protein